MNKMKKFLFLLLVFIHLESNGQTQIQPTIGPFSMGDSLQKIIDIIESRNVREELRLQIIKPITPNYIFDNQSYFLNDIFSYKIDRKYYDWSYPFKYLEVLIYYSDALSGTGGLCSDVLEVKLDGQLKINDYLSFSDIKYSFKDSILFEMNFKITHDGLTENKNILYELFKGKFGNPSRVAENNYYWYILSNNLIYNSENSNVHFYNWDVKEQIASIEKDLIRKQIEELSKETEKGIKEGF
jgi:hypothetical protein